MTKIIQPLNDPDEIREAAAEATKEEFADFYVNQPMPDPLDFHPDRAKLTHPLQPELTLEELSRQNDPLKDT